MERSGSGPTCMLMKITGFELTPHLGGQSFDEGSLEARRIPRSLEGSLEVVGSTMQVGTEKCWKKLIQEFIHALCSECKHISENVNKGPMRESAFESHIGFQLTRSPAK